MPGEGLSQVGDYPPGDGVDDQAQGLIAEFSLRLSGKIVSPQ